MQTWAVALLVGSVFAGAVLVVVGLVRASAGPVERPEVPGADGRDRSQR